jgi:hypothetical protein
VLPGGDLESWKVGTTMFVLPVIHEDMPAGLKQALERRRRATMDGVCACGARRSAPSGSRPLLHAVTTHEHDCPAHDDAIERMYREWRGPS